MHFAILGATGGIGRLLIDSALDQGHDITAFARSPEKIARKDNRLHVLRGDLFNASQMASAIKGSDAVLSAFGPVVLRPTHQRRDFGRALVEALRAASVDRFIHVSSAFLFRDGGLLIKVMANTLFYNVTADGRDSEAEMMQPDLRWTIVRPPRLTDGPLTGHARIVAGHLPKGGFTVSRADVAAFMLQEAAAPQFVRQVVGISN
ncbi:MAG TPA: SDR family oxidoreductase [Edaphobacter sp.]|nr:SDR family oxidoreductase [Edaphobacter sp.]